MDQKPDSPPVSVIVSAFSVKRFPELVEQIRQLNNQTFSDIEVIYVISGSNDLAERLEDHLTEQAEFEYRVLFLDEDHGIAWSRNKGIEAANGDIVAFLDDDALPNTEWIEQVLEEFNDPKVNGLAGKVEPRWTDERPVHLPRELYWLVSCTYFPDANRRRPIRNGFGANMAFRRGLFEDIGGFDERLGIRPGQWIGGEDTEFFARVQNLTDGLVLYSPHVSVDHVIPGGRLDVLSLLKRSVNAGISIRVLDNVSDFRRNSNGGDVESKYLRRLLTETLPREVRSVANLGGLQSLGKAAMTVGVIGAVGAGYLWEILTRRATASVEMYGTDGSE